MKKHSYLKQSKKLLLAAMTIPLAVSVLPVAENIYASEIPTLNVYELNGSPKLEWATEILQENVILKTNFSEGSILPNLSLGNVHGNGGQSYISEDGNRYLSVTDTINKGNLYYYPQTSSKLSGALFNNHPTYINNGSYLSVSFKAKSKNSNNSNITLESNPPRGDYPVNLFDNKANNIIIKESITLSKGQLGSSIKVGSSDGELIYLKDGELYTIAIGEDYKNYGLVYGEWNQAAQSFTVTSSNFPTHISSYEFKQNNKIKTIEWIGLKFPSRNIEDSSEWHNYNLNTIVDSNNYNYGLDGITTRIQWQTEGTLDIDDVTFGYATEVEVYRDGQSVYKGFLSDFHDTSVRDNVEPNKISEVDTVITSDFNVHLKLSKPNDNGVKSKYQIQSISKNGTKSALSVPQEIEIKTDVVKYKYSIGNESSNTPSIETQSLNDIIVPLKSINLETDYLHVQAIDMNGNVSQVSSFKLDELIDMKDLYDKIKEIEKNNNYEDFIDFIDEIEQIYGDNIPEDLKEMIDKLGQHHGVNTSFLLLEEGDFRLTTSDIQDFGKVKLTAEKQTIMSNFLNEFNVIDARGTQEGWNVTVSATPFTVETFDGFVGSPHQLPMGSLALNAIHGVEQVGTVHNSQLPDITLNQLTTIDGENQTVNLLNADKQKGMGEFKFSFVPDSLALTVDAVTAKIDTINYPDQNTPYASTVTWNLISGPQV